MKALLLLLFVITFSLNAQQKYNPFLDSEAVLIKEGNSLRISEDVTIRLIDSEWVVFNDYQICRYHIDKKKSFVVSSPYTGDVIMLMRNLAWQYDCYLYDSEQANDEKLFIEFIKTNDILVKGYETTFDYDELPSRDSISNGRSCTVQLE